MESQEKKRAVVSYENMKEELSNAFSEKYPKGYSDYLPDLQKYDKPDGTFFYAVEVETETAVYLVKIKVKTDDVEDIERWLDDSGDLGIGAGGDDGGEEDLPDNDISQYTADGEDDGLDGGIQ